MTLQILGGLLQDYVDSLLNEGVLNDQFKTIHSQIGNEEPESVVKLIESYFRDVEAILLELSSHADDDESNVDLSKLSVLAREIEEKSTSIGAEHVKLACIGLIEACDENLKRKFDRSVMWVTTEFSNTKIKLQSYVRMERRIIRQMEARAKSLSSSLNSRLQLDEKNPTSS